MKDYEVPEIPVLEATIKLLELVQQKFTSSNSVPVERITLTAEEMKQIGFDPEITIG